MTFSIIAFDPATGDLGVAVQSKFPNVGVSIPFAKAGVGAVATKILLQYQLWSTGTGAIGKWRYATMSHCDSDRQ